MSDTVQSSRLLPGGHNYEVYQGDDFAPRSITVKNSAGVGYALTTAKMQIKTLSDTVAVTLTVGSGITITNPGQIDLSVAAATMATLAPTQYKYDLEVTFTASGKKRTILSGFFTVTAQTTT